MNGYRNRCAAYKLCSVKQLLPIFKRMLTIKIKKKDGSKYDGCVIIVTNVSRKQRNQKFLCHFAYWKKSEVKRISAMSIHSDHSEWYPVDVDSLDNIDKEIQLVSTSTSSGSQSLSDEDNGSGNDLNLISDCIARTEETPGQSSKNLSLSNSKSGENVKVTNLKLHSSCDDLSLGGHGDKNEVKLDDPNIVRSNTFANFKSNKSCSHKYDHIESKIKQFFRSNETKVEPPPEKEKNSVITKSYDKEEYLEEINKQLVKELDEKNAILSLLQENYERLLFKYAEAQNRIDELRFKFLTETNEPKNFCPQIKHSKTDNVAGGKCQKAVVAPFIKVNDPFHSPLEEKASVKRPSSLPLDGSMKVFDKDLIKATTPTDSEGLSSIITSMSGHSKILNSLDEENQMSKNQTVLVYQAGHYVVENNSNLSDSFSKVKNWQNSLPPLEQIETPETTLYNVSSNTGGYSSVGTKYKEIPSPKNDQGYLYLDDESCPPSWREERQVDYVESDSFKSKSREINQNSLRANKNDVHHSLNVKNCLGHDESTQTPNDVPSGCMSQTQAPLSRCSSLPGYDNESSGKVSKNGIYIPPLDLGNVTLSDDESYCQHDYYPNECKTGSSFPTSRGISVNQSIQTPLSLSSCKVTISGENSSTRGLRKTFNKSTSISPDRSKNLDLSGASKSDSSWPDVREPYTKERKDCCSDKSKTWCNICGESILENTNGQIFRNRSNSCESIPNSEISSVKTSSKRPRFPFKRSVSFGSGTNTPKYSPREEHVSRNLLFSERSQESLENFEIYANNLKARSQVVIKALTAHVNNS